VPRRGACAPDCTRCGEVCPTGAIPRLTVTAKAQQPIGLAVVDQERCIPWASDETCLVCEEHCPVADKAIRLEPGPHGVDAPVVRAKDCTGCGWCERVCPLAGESAIRVMRKGSGVGVTRKGSGVRGQGSWRGVSLREQTGWPAMVSPTSAETGNPDP
jgi:ferredoxin